MVFRRVVFFVIPVILMILLSTGAGILVGFIANDWLRISLFAAFGIALSFVLAKIIRWLGDWANVEIQSSEISLPDIFKRFTLGILIGLWVSIVSGFAFAHFENIPINWDSFGQGIPVRIAASVLPAATEEVVFRYGIVQGVSVLAGVLPAAAAGSIPFGLIHLINNLFGMNVSLLQTVGVVVAGLLLTLLYLRFGLLTAIGCHLAWNSLASSWVDSLSLPKGPGMAMFEGAWSTSFVLIVGCILLFFIPQPRGKNGRIFS